MKMAESSLVGRKHRGKRRNCSYIYSRHVQPGLVWERVELLDMIQEGVTLYLQIKVTQGMHG